MARLDDMFPVLIFAPACPGSPEKVSEVVLVLKWVSQYLGQWPLPAGKALVDLVQKNNCMSCNAEHNRRRSGTC